MKESDPYDLDALIERMLELQERIAFSYFEDGTAVLASQGVKLEPRQWVKERDKLKQVIVMMAKHGHKEDCKERLEGMSNSPFVTWQEDMNGSKEP
jgi:hypothetical protein